MRLAVINHLGDKAAGAEHALVQYVSRLPADIQPLFFLFEDGNFAQSLRENFGSVTIVPMSNCVASAERGQLPLAAIPDVISHVLRLARALRAASCDMVLTNSMKAHIIGSVAARLLGLPCVNYVHDFVTGNARRLLSLVSGLCAQERVTCSKAVAANLRLSRSTPVYSGIDTAAYRTLPNRALAKAALGLPDDELPVVALVGRIARWKGQDRFIRIAAEVLRTIDAHFVVVGSPIFGCDSGYVPELMTAVTAANAQERIHFVPWQHDMRNVYAVVDLAANCSTREPFARTMLEALASGIPIVCFDDAGSCEILEEHRCGTHVPAGDEAAFAAAVRTYLTGPGVLEKAQAIARVAAQRFDIDVAWQAFAEVIVRVGARGTRTVLRPAIRVSGPEPSAPR